MQGELPTRNHLSWKAIAISIEYFRFVEKLVRPTATAGHESNEHQKLIKPLESFYGLANIASETLLLGRKQDEFLEESFCKYRATGVPAGLIVKVGTLFLSSADSQQVGGTNYSGYRLCLELDAPGGSCLLSLEPMFVCFAWALYKTRREPLSIGIPG